MSIESYKSRKERIVNEGKLNKNNIVSLLEEIHEENISYDLIKRKYEKSYHYLQIEICNLIDIDCNNAEKMVQNSFFPKIIANDPEMVLHYDFEYWALKVIEFYL